MHLLKKLIPFIFVLSVVPWISQGSSQEDIGGVISWMYDNGLTSYVSQDQFRPDKIIRRDEASKFVTKFSQTILFQEGQENSVCYMFTDIPKKSTLRDYIIQACELGHMKGSKNQFSPSGNLSNAQAIAIIIRMYEGVLEEPKSDRSKNYYQRAEELGLLEDIPVSDKKKPITRGDFAILLYRLGTQLNQGQIRENSEGIYNGLSGLDTAFSSIEDALSSGLNTMIGAMMEAMTDLMGLKINSHTGLNNNFINQASICIPGSSITTQTNFDMLGININLKDYTRINGMTSGKCEVYKRIDGVDIKILSGHIQEALSNGATIDEINKEFSIITGSFENLLGENGVCLYDTGTLVSNLQNELSGNFIPSSFINSSQPNCTGSLYQDN